MLIFRIRTFCILRRLEIVKYVQHMLAGGRHVHQWTHEAKMADLFFLFTCATEPFVAFVRISVDQSATRSGTLTKLNALFLLPRFYFLWLSKHV